MKNLFLFVFTLFALSVHPQIAGAQGVNILENYRVDMPDIKPLDEKTTREMTKLYTVAPEDEKSLAFEIRIPKNWESVIDINQDTNVLARNVFDDLVRFYSPGNVQGRSSLNISVSKMEYEMSAEHWALRHLLSRGLPSKGFNTIDRNRAEFFYVDVEGDITYAVRALAQRNGKYMLFARYAVPLSVAKEQSPLQASVLNSFKILNPVQVDVETMVEYRFLDLVSIKHPSSWTLKAPRAKSMDRMNVDILNFNKNSTASRKNLALDGKISGYLSYYFAVEDLQKEQQSVIDEVIEDPLVMGEEIDVSEFDVSLKLKEVMDELVGYELKAYEVSNKTGDTLNYEFWMTTLEIGDYYYIFTLLTPTRNENFFIWSRNVETYNLILKSIQPNLDLLIYEE